MRSIIIYILLLTGFAYAQTSKPTKSFYLEGSWTVSKYTFADVSAMTDKVAQEWMGKKATVKKVIHFPYYDIPSYKNIFTESYCEYNRKRHLHPDTIVSTEKYFKDLKINSAKLGITAKTIKLVRTGCKESPFKEMIVKNEDEIIIFWDGTFFTLTRDKK